MFSDNADVVRGSLAIRQLTVVALNNVSPGRSIHGPARHMLNKWRAPLKLDTDVSIEPILIR